MISLVNLNNIQDGYLESREKASLLVDTFQKTLKEKDRNTIIDRFHVGQTGKTFQCSLPSTALPKAQEVKPISFVLKWQGEGECFVEQVGNQIFRAMGFSSPQIHMFSSDASRNIVAASSQTNMALKSKLSKKPFLVMPMMNGINLKDAIETGALQKLSIEDKKTLLNVFGQLTAVDMFIANDDRFIAFTNDPENPFFAEPSINLGNVLIEFDEISGGLKKVHAIDNCVSPDLVDEYSEENEVENYHQIFAQFYDSSERVVEEFRKGMLKSIEEAGQDTSEYDDLLSMIDPEYTRGIQKGFAKLRSSSKLLEHIDHLRNDTVANIFELIKSNQKFLSEIH